jgi:GAF domain-containing protein
MDPAYPKPANESQRLAALRGLRVLDSEREQSFDEISKLAAYICGTPISTVSLVDADRQWFKSRQSIEITETPRDQSFCGHTIMSDGVMVVEDALQDGRFAGTQLVTGNPHVRFYAGAPLTTGDALNIGALCVMDSVPRKLTAEQREALLTLSKMVMTEFRLRDLNQKLADAMQEVKALRDILPTCSYCSNIRNEQGEWSSLEDYITDETHSRFSHGVCPTCAKVHFPGYDLQKAKA